MSRHNERSRELLQPGDLVEFPRGAYSHWAVYVGNGKVIHYAGADGDFGGKLTGKIKVREDDLVKVAGTWGALKHNLMDYKYRPLPRDEIVRRARSSIGKGGYSLIFSNCEHFANWCRYDKAESMQVQVVTAALSGGIGIVPGTGVLTKLNALAQLM